MCNYSFAVELRTFIRFLPGVMRTTLCGNTVVTTLLIRRKGKGYFNSMSRSIYYQDLNHITELYLPALPSSFATTYLIARTEDHTPQYDLHTSDLIAILRQGLGS